MPIKKAISSSSPAKTSTENAPSTGTKKSATAKMHSKSVAFTPQFAAYLKVGVRRKTEDQSDDSDIQIIESPTPAKKKRVIVKRERSLTPTPGSQAFQSLPAVSVSNIVMAAMKAAASSSSSPATFGSPESKIISNPVSADRISTKTDNQYVSPIGRPERAKLMTEKAKYSATVGSNNFVQASSLVKPKAKGKEVARALTRSFHVTKQTVNETAHDNSELSESEWPATPPNIKFEDGGDADATWSEPDPDVAEDEVNDIHNVPEESPAEAISADTEEDPTIQVMLKSIQDPELAPIYVGLPDLGVYRSVRQYAYLNTVGIGIVTLKDVQKRVGSEDVARLVRALLFTKSGFFVNPARVSPDVFVAEAGRLKVKDPSSMAVCIMTGIITECSIISEGTTGGPDNEKTVHKVSIAPFQQDFRRDTTMWGRLLNFHSLSCGISTEGLSFTTRPRTLTAPLFKSNSSSGSPKTPKKGGSRTMTVVHSPTPARRPDNYITTRTFEQRVPIYDGRSVEGAREFTFSDKDFAKLSGWPLYEHGLQDVPYDAVVSVGYTLNTFGEALPDDVEG